MLEVVASQSRPHFETQCTKRMFFVCLHHSFLVMVALRNRADHYIFALWFLLLSFFFFSSPNLSRRRLDVCHTSTHGTWCGLNANLRCRSETCCTRLAGNAWTQKIRQKSPSWHHRSTLSGYIFATKARIDNRFTSLGHPS